MAAPPVFCNACFQKPRGAGAAPQLHLTSCGHVVCERCLPTDKKDVCVICRVPCRTIMLSKKVNSDIQSLFMRIDGLCRKYSKEVSQISKFQEKHRGHLLTYYRGKIAKLEGHWKATQQMKHTQHQQHLKPRQEATQVPSCISVRTPVSKNQNECASFSLHPTHLSTPEISAQKTLVYRSDAKCCSFPALATQKKTNTVKDPLMEIDYVPSSVRKVETVTGPTRLSLISPPQNGHMGSVSCRSSRLSGMALSQNSTSESVRSTPLRMPSRETPYVSQTGSSQNNNSSVSDAFGLRTPQHYRYSATPSVPVITRCPISLADLLQKQHLGPTSLGERLLQK